MKITAFLILFVMLTVATAFAQELPLIKSSALQSTPIIAGGFKLKLDIGSFLGTGLITVDIQNPGKSAIPFLPSRLSFVQMDGLQIDIAFLQLPRETVNPQEILVNGGAHLRRKYILSDVVHYPVKVYFDGIHVAELVD